MSKESSITDFEQGKQQGKKEMIYWLENVLCIEKNDFFNPRGKCFLWKYKGCNHPTCWSKRLLKAAKKAMENE